MKISIQVDDKTASIMNETCKTLQCTSEEFICSAINLSLFGMDFEVFSGLDESDPDIMDEIMSANRKKRESVCDTSSCKYCGQNPIYWGVYNGYRIPFDDMCNFDRHTCREYKEAKNYEAQRKNP